MRACVVEWGDSEPEMAHSAAERGSGRARPSSSQKTRPTLWLLADVRVAQPNDTCLYGLP